MHPAIQTVINIVEAILPDVPKVAHYMKRGDADWTRFAQAAPDHLDEAYSVAIEFAPGATYSLIVMADNDSPVGAYYSHRMAMPSTEAELVWMLIRSTGKFEDDPIGALNAIFMALGDLSGDRNGLLKIGVPQQLGMNDIYYELVDEDGSIITAVPGGAFILSLIGGIYRMGSAQAGYESPGFVDESIRVMSEMDDRVRQIVKDVYAPYM